MSEPSSQLTIEIADRRGAGPSISFWVALFVAVSLIVRMLTDSLETTIGFVVLLALLATAGAARNNIRRKLILERGSENAMLETSLAGFRRQKTLPLGSHKELTIEQKVEVRSSGRAPAARVYFSVVLESSPTSVEIFRAESYQDAREKAERIARFLGCQVNEVIAGRDREGRWARSGDDGWMPPG